MTLPLKCNAHDVDVNKTCSDLDDKMLQYRYMWPVYDILILLFLEKFQFSGVLTMAVLAREHKPKRTLSLKVRYESLVISRYNTQ